MDEENKPPVAPVAPPEPEEIPVIDNTSPEPAPTPEPTEEPQPSKEEVISEIREKAKDSEVEEITTDLDGEKADLVKRAESESAVEIGVKPVEFGEKMKKPSKAPRIVLIVVLILLLSVVSVFLFAPNLISNLFSASTSPTPQTSQTTTEEKETEIINTETKTEPEEEEEEENTAEKEAEPEEKYFEIPEWGVKFEYPENVTEISTSYNQIKNTSAKDSFAVYDLTYSGTKYDYTICGNDYPVGGQVSMILSRIIRYNPSEPSTLANYIESLEKIYEDDTYAYYLESSLTNNGPCVTPELSNSNKAQTAASQAILFLKSISVLEED